MTNKRQPQTIIGVAQLKEPEPRRRYAIQPALSKTPTKRILNTGVDAASVKTAAYPPRPSSRTLTGTRNQGSRTLIRSNPAATKREILSKRKGMMVGASWSRTNVQTPLLGRGRVYRRLAGNVDCA